MSASQTLSDVNWLVPGTEHEQRQISPAVAASVADALHYDVSSDDLCWRVVHENPGQALWSHLRSEFIFHLLFPSTPSAAGHSWIGSHPELLRGQLALLRAACPRVGAADLDTSTSQEATGLYTNRVTTESYDDRLGQLREFAQDDGESVNEDSVGRFLAFLAANRVVRRASLVLNNANDLCARWRDDGMQEINAEFFADGRVLWSAIVAGEHQDARISSHEDFIRDLQAAGLGALLHE